MTKKEQLLERITQELDKLLTHQQLLSAPAIGTPVVILGVSPDTTNKAVSVDDSGRLQLA